MEAFPSIYNLTKSITAVILISAIVAFFIDDSCRVFSVPIWSIARDLIRSRICASGSLLNMISYYDGFTSRGVFVLDDTIHDAIAAPIRTFPLVSSASI